MILTIIDVIDEDDVKPYLGSDGGACNTGFGHGKNSNKELTNPLNSQFITK